MADCLYRHYDKKGRLLYVGVASNLITLWRGHQLCGSPWVDDVATIAIERFPTREEDPLRVEHRRTIANERSARRSKRARP